MSQLDINFSRQARDKGIDKAISNADRVNPGWSDEAYELFKRYIEDHNHFLIEDFRHWAEDKIETPPSNRAFGAIAVRAKKENLISRVRYSPVKNVRAHRCICTVWEVNSKTKQ